MSTPSQVQNNFTELLATVQAANGENPPQPAKPKPAPKPAGNPAPGKGRGQPKKKEDTPAVPNVDPKVEPPPSEEGKPGEFNTNSNPIPEAVMRTLSTSGVLRMKVQELRDIVWPEAEKGKYPNMSTVKGVLLGAYQKNWNGDYADQVDQVSKTLISSIFYKDELVDWEVGDAITHLLVEKISKARVNPNPAPKKGSEFRPGKDEINEIFNIGSDTSHSAETLLAMSFNGLTDEQWKTILGLIDTFANVAPAPSKGYAIAAKQKSGTDASTVGQFQKRLKATVSNEEIITVCIQNLNVRQLITRCVNPAVTYKAFLSFMDSQSKDTGGGLNWSWANMLGFIKRNKYDLCKEFVDESMERFKSTLKFTEGMYGPLIWLIYPDNLLEVAEELNEKLKSVFVEANRGKIYCPRDVQLHILVNIPLCGSECYSTMTFQQIQRRARVGLPWAKFAKVELSVPKNPNSEQVMKLINKSATENRKFLQQQNQGNKRLQQKTGRNSNKKFTNKQFDMGSDYVTV